MIGESEYKRVFLNGVVKNYFENSYKEWFRFLLVTKVVGKRLGRYNKMIENGRD
jgi:hypothetical protein